jgi:hypothetical protein
MSIDSGPLKQLVKEKNNQMSFTADNSDQHPHTADNSDQRPHTTEK